VPTSPRLGPTTPRRKGGPTAEQRGIANAQVQAAAATLAVLERRLDKTMVRAPANGIVTVRPRSSQA
jgi:multidrug resistance efflux pump